MACRRPGDKPLSKQIMVRLPMHICVTHSFQCPVHNTLKSLLSLHFLGLLTLWPLEDWIVILKLLFSNSLYGMVASKGLCCEIALRLMPLNLTNENLTWVQVLAWCPQETSHYLNQWWTRSPTSYGINRLHWVNSLRPSDAIWRHRSGSTLVQVMACCLTALSHYLNQCWLIISKA